MNSVGLASCKKSPRETASPLPHARSQREEGTRTQRRPDLGLPDVPFGPPGPQLNNLCCLHPTEHRSAIKRNEQLVHASRTNLQMLAE